MRPTATAAVFFLMIAPARADLPGPVAIWPSGPLEVRAAFSTPIDPAEAKGWVDRFITFAPAGKDPQPGAKPADPPKNRPDAGQELRKGRLRIAAVSLQDDNKTLVLATDPHPFPAQYHLATSTTKPFPDLLAYDLHGVEASWDSGKDADEPEATVWWPELGTDAARKGTKGSAEHDRFLGRLSQAGRLTLRTQFAPPEQKGTLWLAANVPFRATLGNTEKASQPAATTGHEIALPIDGSGIPEELVVTLPTGRPEPALRVTHEPTAPGGTPFAPGWLLLPWAPAPPTTSDAPFEAPYKLDGGDAGRGRAVFFAEESKCAVCHKVGDKGGSVGPDLTRPRQQDLLALYRAIAEPSAEIHPEFVPYTIATKDGQIAVGTVRAEGADAIRVLDTEGKATILKRADLQLFKPGNTSIMPVGLAGAIGEEKMRDLLAFLKQAR